MNIEEANGIPMAVILASIGCPPAKVKPQEDWYLSPLRGEKTASFKINKKTNAWYDFGEGVGGDVVNFVCAYLKSHHEDNTVADALRWINNMTSYRPGITPMHCPDNSQDEPKLVLKKVTEIQHRLLITYLEKRGISLPLAKHYLKEITVLNKDTDKSFFALSFQNDDEGFELRNPYFKGSIRPKTVSFIRGSEVKPQGLHIFEGFLDFLSALQQKNLRQFKEDAIVLNSLSFVQQATAYIKAYGYKLAHTWLDNDNAGEKATAAFKEFFKTEENLIHKPMNTTYAAHKDVNAWHMHTLNLTL